jgi:recombinational DNA repair protein RecT
MNEQQFTAAALDTFGRPEFSRFDTAAKVQAIVRFAVLGLYPGPQAHAYVIPRGPSLDVMPGFRGYQYLAEQLPGVARVTAHIVHTSDEFKVATVGVDEYVVLQHSYDPLPPSGGRVFTYPDKGVKGAYVKMQMMDKSVRFHFCTVDYINKARGCAQTQKVWKDWFEQMVLKTAIRSARNRGFFSGDEQIDRRMSLMGEADDEVLDNDPHRTAEPEAPVSTIESVMARLSPPSESVVEPAHDPETGEIASDAVCAPQSDEECDAPFSDEDVQQGGLL